MWNLGSFIELFGWLTWHDLPQLMCRVTRIGLKMSENINGRKGSSYLFIIHILFIHMYIIRNRKTIMIKRCWFSPHQFYDSFDIYFYSKLWLHSLFIYSYIFRVYTIFVDQNNHETHFCSVNKFYPLLLWRSIFVVLHV